VTPLPERLVELKRHVTHVRGLRPRVSGPETLSRDLSLHNDVLFSLLTICQLVIDVSGELSSRRGDRFENYTEAVRNLERDARFPVELVRRLQRLPGFRNVLIHEYVALDPSRVIEAMDEMGDIEQFIAIVAEVESGTGGIS